MSKSDKRFFDPQNNAGHAITPLQHGDTQIRLRQLISLLSFKTLDVVATTKRIKI